MQGNPVRCRYCMIWHLVDILGGKLLWEGAMKKEGTIKKGRDTRKGKKGVRLSFAGITSHVKLLIWHHVDIFQV